MRVIKILFQVLYNQFSLYFAWFKRVLLHDKIEIFLYREHKLNQKFNQYYKFPNALKNYELITVNEACRSWHVIREQQVEDHKELIKSFWPEKYHEIKGTEHSHSNKQKFQ